MEILQYLIEHQIPYEQNVLLSSKSWVRTGGRCALWITPTTVEQLTEVCRFLYGKNKTFDVVGQTSNIFFHSTYHPQVVVSTVNVNRYEWKDDMLTCDCGVSVVKLAKDMLSQGYAGFYGLVGLPGTVASAAVNNAGCFDCSISSLLVSAEVLTSDGAIKTVGKEDFKYSHRSSAFKRGEKSGVVLSVSLKAERAVSVEEEYKKSDETVAFRREKQERQGRTLGSVFASKSMRKNFRNNIVKIALKVLPKLSGKDPRYILKRTVLALYGCRNLNKYVSDRQINTFIWRDEKAESAFERYKEMMNRVYENLQIEIEEKK